MRRPAVLTLAVVALLALAAPAFAGVGLHGGFSIDPDDFLIGVHFESKPVAEDLRFVPSVEVGFGDVTMVAGNADLHYMFDTSSARKPFVGGGFTINWFDTDNDDDIEFGGSILGGLALNEKYFVEAKVGLGDVPDWKFLIGVHMP